MKVILVQLGEYAILLRFLERIKQFDFFSTALLIDETMIKYYGKTKLKQYIKEKPVQFGIKQWSLCSSEGYLFDCDIYCDKKGQTLIFKKIVLLSINMLWETKSFWR